MAIENIDKMLEELRQSLDRLRASVAWYWLKEDEHRRGDPPVLLMNDHLASEIRNMNTNCVALEDNILRAVNDTCGELPAKRREALRHEVAHLRHSRDRLGVPKDS